MPNTVNDAWQQAVRETDIASMAALVTDVPMLVHQQIVHTRGNGTTFGRLPLEMVNKNLDAVKLLVEAGADLLRAGDGNALPIHNASLDVMTFLLDSGANVNQIGYEECTPLMYEVYMRNYDGAQLLISRGADVNYQRSLDGLSPLHFSVQKRDIRMIELLLAAGAHTSLKNTDGKTPADLAHELNANKIVSKLELNEG